ncbi:cyclic-phosphate processing receiver domain-containing protein [Sutcliffiella halmapala]|uniref:cyclic-phosphate processing receiver domain-containing protein n=1 Tax=Sutcliffiella halmapala TaxID=79882 RepID=UPI002E2734C8
MNGSRNIGGAILKINVFLDDYRACPNGYILAEDIDECLTLLENNAIEHLSLDHDLLNRERNGLLLVQIMVENELYAERITIHSANSVGSKAMYNYLKQAQAELKIPPTIKILLRPLPLFR